jgi:hypothetical protein
MLNYTAQNSELPYGATRFSRCLSCAGHVAKDVKMLYMYMAAREHERHGPMPSCISAYGHLRKGDCHGLLDVIMHYTSNH